MTMVIIDDDIAKGFDHLETIAAVHYGKSAEEYAEAIGNLSEFFGMDEIAQGYLLARVSDFVPTGREEAKPWVIIGFLIGMATAQYGSKSY